MSKTLQQRIRELEQENARLMSYLKCAECGHLRREHEDDDSPCHGGRTRDMRPGEGEYCMCEGFVSLLATRSERDGEE